MYIYVYEDVDTDLDMAVSTNLGVLYVGNGRLFGRSQDSGNMGRRHVWGSTHTLLAPRWV